MEPLEAACSGAPGSYFGVLFQDLLCWGQLSGTFVQWDAGFIILYKLCYKLCQCKLGVVLYAAWFASKKNQFLCLLTKEIKNFESVVQSEHAEGHFLPSYPLNC